jgi:hypothetical protein
LGPYRDRAPGGALPRKQEQVRVSCQSFSRHRPLELLLHYALCLGSTLAQRVCILESVIGGTQPWRGRAVDGSSPHQRRSLRDRFCTTHAPILDELMSWVRAQRALRKQVGGESESNGDTEPVGRKDQLGVECPGYTKEIEPHFSSSRRQLYPIRARLYPHLTFRSYSGPNGP